MAHSLLLDCARLGMDLTVITPPGYEPDAGIFRQAEGFARRNGCQVRISNDLEDGLRGAEAVYTDVWASMGQEHEAFERARVFAPYQVNIDLMHMAAPGALFLHCLPAHRDEEVTDAVMESNLGGGLRPGGEPAARAEGADCHAAARVRPGVARRPGMGRRAPNR